jgi:hypothetical protein
MERADYAAAEPTVSARSRRHWWTSCRIQYQDRSEGRGAMKADIYQAITSN